MHTSKKLIVLIIIAILVGSVLGALAMKSWQGGDTDGQVSTTKEKPKAPTTWTCSMHPQIKLSKPGQCPICGMDLIPLEEQETAGSQTGSLDRSITLSETARKLARIQAAPARRMFVSNEIRMVGKVEYDETRLNYITAWVPGRLDRLYVDYTGIPVKKGDHLVYLYSDELLSAQQELIESIKAVNTLQGSSSASALAMAKSTLKASREKLRLWGLTEEQIIELGKQEKPSDHITIYSPISGIVVHKNLNQGSYVKTGDRIYTIADLSKVWIKLDAYESDLTWLRYGQTVEFEVEAYAGETFKGTVSFIDPILNEKTRTIKVRVNVDNQNGRLKPGMFVRAVLRSKLTAAGKVIDPALAGKWISPMHPEIVKDEPGNCDVCNMPLVKAETLGYASEENGTAEAPLVIPTSAPLITGKRAVVYIEDPVEEGRYEGREIKLGPRAGNFYVVLDGLQEGELVVQQGNFKIDSAIQILGKPSMMNPQGGAPVSGHNHGGSKMPEHNQHDKMPPEQMTTPKAFQKQVSAVYAGYFKIQTALSKDDLAVSLSENKKLQKIVTNVDMGLLQGDSHMAWMRHLKELNISLDKLSNSGDLQEARESFALLSESLLSIVSVFGSEGGTPIYKVHCPMAFNDRGADWLQDSTSVANPYFGSSMHGCGAVKETMYEPKK